MSEQTFNLDRENNIKESVDAFGKQWKIHVQKGNGLCYVRPNPDREDAIIPEKLQGLWTKPSLVQPLIKAHCVASWDQAAAAKLKADRQEQAAKEQELLKKKQVKGKNDERSTSK
jgi:hypothetical protein